jgi:hypothetical protein
MTLIDRKRIIAFLTCHDVNGWCLTPLHLHAFSVLRYAAN